MPILIRMHQSRYGADGAGRVRFYLSGQRYVVSRTIAARFVHKGWARI